MSSLKINRATYGGSNCLEKVKSLVKNDKLILRVSNEIIGDPQPGVLKYLEIEVNGILEKIKEGDTFVYPKSTTNKLGIWYSNDTTNHPAVQKSLETIKKASEGKADIITCVWNSIPNNPFYQITSWNRSSSHLNQLLQILQCIYVGKTMGEYEYVSFLEHDVMYGEGYFDYPNFSKGEVWTNMNYEGINKEGWQYRGQNDEPMHQMTMKVEDALQHFHSILGNALVTNSGMIEDQKFVRKQWECKNPSVHINHGSHFTSHFSIYRKDNTYKIHPYWGEHSQYHYLFP
jgi:hypothetical protein